MNLQIQIISYLQTTKGRSNKKAKCFYLPSYLAYFWFYRIEQSPIPYGNSIPGLFLNVFSFYGRDTVFQEYFWRNTVFWRTLTPPYMEDSISYSIPVFLSYSYPAG